MNHSKSVLEQPIDSLVGVDPNQRRLGGVARLFGEDGFAALQTAHVLVVGLGGVGSWAAEALVRSAVGEITLMDYDHISMSNVNRQLHAIEGDFGKSKVAAMVDRLLAINPDLKVHQLDHFIKPDNVGQYILPGMAVLDATDDLLSKVAMAVWCVRQNIAFVMSGAAGGKLDPTQISIDDLSKTTHDPILSKIRGILRKSYGFESDPKRRMRVRVVYSGESRMSRSQGGLSCAGYGSAVTVTASFGFVAAAELMNQIMRSHKSV